MVDLTLTLEDRADVERELANDRAMRSRVAGKIRQLDPIHDASYITKLQFQVDAINRAIVRNQRALQAGTF